MWIAIVAAVILLVVLFRWLAKRSLQSSIEDGRRLASEVQIEEVPSLSNECLEAFRSKFKVNIDLRKPNEAATLFDTLLFERKNDVKFTFARPGDYGRFVLPLGSALGEIMRAQTGAEWVKEDDQAIAVRVKIRDEFLLLRPFDDILNFFSKWHPAGTLEGPVQAALQVINILDEEKVSGSDTAG
jgi:hypothetical protein